MMTSDREAAIMRRWALAYAARGWRVFPVVPGTKRPACDNGLRDATTDPVRIKAWWRREPYGIAVATGPLSLTSGLYVLDVDQHGPDGEEALWAAQRRLVTLPVTAEQQTGGGGRQLFFTYPGDRDLRNTCGDRGLGLGPGLDSRGAGGYAILPPSLHPSGARYRWTLAPWDKTDSTVCRLAELPAAWVERLERKPVELERVIHFDPADADEIIRERAQRIARAQPGGRNHTLYGEAIGLAHRAAAGKLDWHQAHAALFGAARAAGLPAWEARRTLESAAQGAGVR